MKKVTLLIAILVSFFANAQNGGQFFENNVAKIQFISNTTTTVTFMVISKQNCTAGYKVDYGTTETVTIPSLDTLVFVVPISTVTFKVKAESQSSCISQPDMGWVEMIVANVINPQVLPVKLISFTGTQKNNLVSLKWEVVNETVGKFELQRSTDGRTFNSIATINKVPGLGSKSYNASDPISTITYYRLKMIDDVNHIDYSKIITFRGTSAYKFKILGNPSAGNQLSFSISSKESEQIKIAMFNTRGQLVMSKLTNISAGENIIDFPTPTNHRGFYRLVVTTKSDTFEESIVKL